jgi:hypothetical protein
VNALSAYRGERFVQGLEDVIGADDVAQARAVAALWATIIRKQDPAAGSSSAAIPAIAT